MMKVKSHVSDVEVCRSFEVNWPCMVADDSPLRQSQAVNSLSIYIYMER